MAGSTNSGQVTLIYPNSHLLTSPPVDCLNSTRPKSAAVVSDRGRHTAGKAWRLAGFGPGRRAALAPSPAEPARAHNSRGGSRHSGRNEPRPHDNREQRIGWVNSTLRCARIPNGRHNLRQETTGGAAAEPEAEGHQRPNGETR